MKVLIATGGSGGHIFPALLTAQELKCQGHEVTLAGHFGKMKAQVTPWGFPIFELTAQGIVSRSIPSMFSTGMIMMNAVYQSMQYLRNNKPDVVVGFGGYAAFPLVFGAALLRYPTMIHEQNVLPGRANTLLSKFVHKIAVSFDQSRKFFPYHKTILTGCPCRQASGDRDRNQILREFHLLPERRTVLVLGGSQGSRAVNAAFIKTAPLLLKEHLVQVIHLTGAGDFAKVQKAYAALSMAHAVFPFSAEIEKAYQVADLVISRAGAVTVAEIAAFNLPAIFIPYPHAGRHQRENAEVLVQAQLAQIIEEEELTPDRLLRCILEFLNNQGDRNEGASKLPCCKSDAAGSIVRTALEIAE